MATIATLKPTTDFQPLSAGYHNGTLTEVEVRDFEQNNYNTGQPETVTKLVISFASDTDPEIDGSPAEGRLFLKLAYGPRAHLTIVRERLLGRELTPEESFNVDDEEFLGKRIRVQCKHRTGKNGRTYGNLDPTSITSLEGIEAASRPAEPKVPTEVPTPTSTGGDEANAAVSAATEEDDLLF